MMPTTRMMEVARIAEQRPFLTFVRHCGRALDTTRRDQRGGLVVCFFWPV